MPKIGKTAGDVRHIIPVSGKDSLCCAICQMTYQPDLPYELLFCDVGLELPETYEWLNSVEKKLGKPINRIGKSLEDEIASVGMLPGFHHRFCTKNTKIYPMHDWLKGTNAIQYIGFRADEADRIPPKGTERANIEDKYPLITLGITLPMVYQILGERDMLPPAFFWQRLYDAVYSQVGPASQRFMEEAKPWTRTYLFSWRSRSNCFCCFYQRLSEWVGLLEFHPDLFDKAEEMERVYGSHDSEFVLNRYEGSRADRQKDYTWIPGYSLKQVRDAAGSIFNKRVAEVVKLVVNARHQPESDRDMLSLTSCGAYCGK